jgi:general secretion pathway protein D
VIDDSQIVVLGGLIDDQLTDGSDSVPLLGQIPIAGALFRYDARHRIKTNLLVFLKPTVVRTASDGQAITSERYDYLQGEQHRWTPPERLFWRDATQPQLPPEGVMPGTPASVPEVPPPPASGGLLSPATPAPPPPPARP